MKKVVFIISEATLKSKTRMKLRHGEVFFLKGEHLEKTCPLAYSASSCKVFVAWVEAAGGVPFLILYLTPAHSDIRRLQEAPETPLFLLTSVLPIYKSICLPCELFHRIRITIFLLYLLIRVSLYCIIIVFSNKCAPSI